MSDRLVAGLDELDEDVITTYDALLPHGEYVPMLLTIEPALVTPGKSGDYLDEEQVRTWGIEAYSGLPVYPGTPYYRTFETPVDDDAHLYEFVVPLQPPSWNEAGRVEEYRQVLTDNDAPTCIAVSILDICTPADAQGEDWYSHWCLTHFLLDGHHKMQAAAEIGRPLCLLALLAVDGGLSSAADIARLPDLRGHRRLSRAVVRPSS